eukprot:scaffold28807_cov67-Phaeocystis_antarctica.AAC.4
MAWCRSVMPSRSGWHRSRACSLAAQITSTALASPAEHACLSAAAALLPLISVKGKGGSAWPEAPQPRRCFLSGVCAASAALSVSVSTFGVKSNVVR